MVQSVMVYVETGTACGGLVVTGLGVPVSRGAGVKVGLELSPPECMGDIGAGGSVGPADPAVPTVVSSEATMLGTSAVEASVTVGACTLEDITCSDANTVGLLMMLLPAPSLP